MEGINVPKEFPAISKATKWLQKVILKGGTSGLVYVPKAWVGKSVIILLIED